MRSRILLAVLAIFLATAAGLWFWAHLIFSSDTVRTALERQLTQSLGQPVAIGSTAASIFPRLSVKLGEVRIGEPPRVQAAALHIGTGLGALLSRRIEGATVRLENARIELPLPDFAPGAPADTAEPALELVSVDEIVLSDVEVVSGGRTLRGDIEASLDGQRLTLTRVELGAGDSTIRAAGAVTDLTGPIGDFQIDAGRLNLDDLIAFASDFSRGMSAAAEPVSNAKPQTPAAPSTSRMNITVSLATDRATLGGVTLDSLAGRTIVGPGRVELEPLAFTLFGGRYEGRLATVMTGDMPQFEWTASLSGLDVAQAAAFAGKPNVISGRLKGSLDLSGRGADAATAMRTARGTARVEVTDGIIRNLGLVRSVVLATSSRSDAGAGSGSSDEPFSRLGATLAIVNGTASTQDLLFESDNLRLAAAGALRLDGSNIQLAGKLQLSDKLSAQAGRDLVRYTQEQGRVTLPVTITGPVTAPIVRVDLADAAGRAIRNRAQEEAQKAIKKGLEGLIRR
jgi:uncharacterized protein involved in outer membrane biogenesis